MKKMLVIMVVVTLGLATAVSAKRLPAVAAKLPADFKQEITNHLEYPKEAKNNQVEGEVWIKVTVDENATVHILDLSATNPELGLYVKKSIDQRSIKKTSIQAGETYFMKIKFDLLN